MVQIQENLERKIELDEGVASAIFDLATFHERISWLLKTKQEGYHATIRQIYDRQLPKIKEILVGVEGVEFLKIHIDRLETVYRQWKENPFRDYIDYHL